MRADIAPGGTFPDYELTDHTKTRRRLSELHGIDPMILVLARGHYCPRDNQQHLQLAAFIRRSPSPTPRSSPSRPTTSSRPTSSAPQSAPSGPSCPTPGGRYRRTWTSRNTPIPHHDPMIPHTFVLKPGLVIYSVYNGYWYWGRPSIEDLRRDLREVTREIRPDWDLASPGLREAWDAGDHSIFHPYQQADRARAAG